VSHRPRIISPALRDPTDAKWGLCPQCKQSAQTRIKGRLSCYRCGWTEIEPRPIFTTPAVPA
jgi:ribosomal protein S27AE